MAAKRLIRPIVTAVLALLLVFPPLTSVVADGLGIELTHHHCDDHDGNSVFDAADEEHATTESHVHTGTKFDPYQCDGCNIAITAMMAETVVFVAGESVAPNAVDAAALVSLSPPPLLKPPIS